MKLMGSVKSGDLVPLFTVLFFVDGQISKNSLSRGKRHQISVKGGQDRRGGLPVLKGGLGTLAETMVPTVTFTHSFFFKHRIGGSHNKLHGKNNEIDGKVFESYLW